MDDNFSEDKTLETVEKSVEDATADELEADELEADELEADEEKALEELYTPRRSRRQAKKPSRYQSD